MSDLVVTEDQWGRLHLYLCGSRPAPLASWHGFLSYQDLADFLTFGLRGPAVDPLDMTVGTFVNEIHEEGRRGEYSRRTDDRVPPPLTFSEGGQPLVDVPHESLTTPGASPTLEGAATAASSHHGGEVGSPVPFFDTIFELDKILEETNGVGSEDKAVEGVPVQLPAPRGEDVG